MWRQIYGLAVTTGTYPQPPDVRALLIGAGLDASRIKRIMPTGGRWKRPGTGEQWTIALDRAGGLAHIDKRAFSDFIADGAMLHVRLMVA